MKLGIIGLGRMGLNMTKRLLNGGHQVVGHDRGADPIREAESYGATGAASIEDLVSELGSPRVVWVMVPAGKPTEETVLKVGGLLSSGDIVIDGGNSNYKDSVRRGQELKSRGVNFVDVGTSGGVWGLEKGYSLMIGGEKAIVEQLRPLFEALAPGPDKGWGHVGPSGAGHFVKMVHNGIEYGLMQAFAEGFAVMEDKKEFDLNPHQVAQIWQHGSVVRSWLLDLIERALGENPDLENIAPWVADSGVARWMVAEALDLNVPAPVITQSLIQRLSSRTENSYADRLLAAMRQQFGGHAIKKA
jgi:6-phosphogluconate dehydrogenase